MTDLPGPAPLLPDAPLRVTDMLGSTYRYIRGNPAATLGIGALLSTVTSAVTGIVINGLLIGGSAGTALGRFISGQTLTPADADVLAQQLTDAVPLLAMVSAVSTLAQLAAMGVMTLGMVRALEGERVSAGDLWSRVPWGRIIAINVRIVVLLLVATALPLVGAFVVGGGGGLALIGVAAAVAVAVTVSTVLAVPAAFREDLTAGAAVRRSLRLTRGAWWRTAWLLGAGLITWQVVGSIIAGPIAAIAGALAGGSSSTAGAALTSIVTGIVTGAITLPADAAMATLVYADLARRRGAAEAQ